MNTDEKVINEIGKFSVVINKESIMFEGILHKIDDEYFLHAIMSTTKYKKINNLGEITITGYIRGVAVSLFRTIAVEVIHENHSYRLELKPSEIAVGYASVEEPKVFKISIQSPQYNYLSDQKVFKDLNDISDNTISLLDYTFQPVIAAKDKIGIIKIEHELQASVIDKEHKFDDEICISVCCTKPTAMTEALGKIAQVRNLFLLLAGHYLPLKDISFSILESSKSDDLAPNECRLLLNYNENVEVKDNLFLVSNIDTKDLFSNIWGRWLDLVDDVPGIPALYYEIACENSTRINKFLNLTQAIEIYSCKYRENESKAICNKYKKAGVNRRDILLQDRFEDLFCLFKEVLGIDKNNISLLAEHLADIRNYFTHYNTTRFNEPSFNEIYCGSYITELLLLVTLYWHIGVPENDYKGIVHRTRFKNLDLCISVIKKSKIKVK